MTWYKVHWTDVRLTLSGKDAANVLMQQIRQLKEHSFRHLLPYEVPQMNEILALNNEDKESSIQRNIDTTKMEHLRLKFLEKCKTYIGVPYKKKYHKPGTPDYHSKLFLDCCGLVRRVLRDLHKEFGFRIGPWNQAYMYDTLPVEVKEEEMRPGDLVFISGVYFNKKFRVPTHNMVHVEVWLGDGPKTVGARWHKGRVQIFESYQFVSTSYHSMTYHFRSIDTWLQGICKSFCQVHSWKRPKRRSPLKKSVFYRARSPVTIENQSNGEENIGDIVDIDASEEESDDSSVSNSAKSCSRKVVMLDPCKEESIEQDAENLLCDSNNTNNSIESLFSSTGSQTCDKSTIVKYVSISKKLDISNSVKEVQTQIQKSDTTNSSSIQAPPLLHKKLSASISRPGSKPVYIFTNKFLTDDMFSSPQPDLDIQGNQIAPEKYKRVSSSSSTFNDSQHFKLADKLVADAIERALAELRLGC